MRIENFIVTDQRNDYTEARKLLVLMGWVDSMPILDREPLVMNYRKLPTVSTKPLGGLLSKKRIEQAPAYGDDLDALDHGTFGVAWPYRGPEVFRDTHQYEFALREVAVLDPNYVIQFDGELPDMPVADAVERMHGAVRQKNQAFEDRVLVVRAAHDAGESVQAIAQALDFTEDGVYKLLRRSEPGDGAGYPHSLEDVRANFDSIEAAMQVRDEMIVHLLNLGLTQACVGRFAGVSRVMVAKIRDKVLGKKVS